MADDAAAVVVLQVLVRPAGPLRSGGAVPVPGRRRSGSAAGCQERQDPGPAPSAPQGPVWNLRPA